MHAPDPPGLASVFLAGEVEHPYLPGKNNDPIPRQRDWKSQFKNRRHWSVQLGFVQLSVLLCASDVSGFLHTVLAYLTLKIPFSTREFSAMKTCPKLHDPFPLTRLTNPRSLHQVWSSPAPHTHLAHHSPQRCGPQCSGAAGRRGGAPAAPDLTPRARVRRAAGTQRTHLAPAHSGTRALPPPARPGLSEVTSEAPLAPGPRRPAGLPLLSRRGQPGLRRRGSGRLRNPPGPAASRTPRGPHQRPHPGGWSGWSLGRPGSGSAFTCAAPTGLQPVLGPAHGGEGARSGSSRAAGGRHRLAWCSGSQRPRDVASAPGRPQPRSLCLGRRRRVTGLRAVSGAGREAGGRELGSASSSSPARGALAGKAHGQRLRAPGGRRGRAREGRGGRAERLPVWRLRPGRAGWGPSQSSGKATSARSRVAAAALGVSEPRLCAGGSPAAGAAKGVRVSPLPYAEGDCGPQRPSRGERRPRLSSSPVHSAHPSPASDSAVLCKARAEWSLR